MHASGKMIGLHVGDLTVPVLRAFESGRSLGVSAQGDGVAEIDIEKLAIDAYGASDAAIAFVAGFDLERGRC